jgi:Tfp pilus assembly protein PilW
MRRGMTLIELLTGMGLMSLLVLGSLTMLVGSLRSLQRTTNDTTMTDQNARAIRKIAENVRLAVSVTVSNNGKTLVYYLPTMTSTNDATTGEKEVVIPPVSDGVARGYTVDFGAGTVTDSRTGKVLVRNIYGYDTEPTSTQYNQAYQPFQVTSIDTNKALTINLVTRDATSGQARTVRMKSTTILPNVP